MSTRTNIEWTDTTWNPVRGCSLVSAGCANCYAMKQAHRFSGKGKPYEGLTELGPQGPRWTGKIRLVPEALEEPLHWKQPRRIFVNSMSDLFHEDVPMDFLAEVFNVMASATVECGRRHRHEEECWTGPHHTFQVLTKRPGRMKSVLTELPYYVSEFYPGDSPICLAFESDHWPLPNVWLGVSVEDQATADERIPILLQTPAAVRFISAEPLLGPITFTRLHQHCQTHDFPGGFCSSPCPDQRFIDWVILGGESGPRARHCDVAWIRSIKEQCQAAGVPVFVKQLGSKPKGWCVGRLHGDEPVLSYELDHCDLYEASEISEPCRSGCHEMCDTKGGDISEFPEDLRVREYPHG